MAFSTKIKTLIFFLLINFIITVFHIDTWNNGNTTSRILPVVAYFETGTFQIDKYHQMTEDKSHIGAHYYSDKAPLPTLIILPVFGLFKMLGMITPVNGSFYGKHVYIIGTILCSIIPFILILYLTFIRLRKYSKFSPVLLSTLPFYASFIFVFAGTCFNHIISALFILLGYIFLKEKKYFFAGLFAGLSFLCEYIVAAMIAIWAVQVLWNERNFKTVFAFCLGVFPSVFAILIYNYIFTGAPFTMLYKFHTYQELHQNYGFNHPTFESLWGILFSSYKGMFFYAPVLFLVLYYVIKDLLKRKIQETFQTLLSNYLMLPGLVIILVISSYFGWWGGWTFGPRLILFVAVLLMYEGVGFLATKDFSKPIFWTLVLLGIVLAFSAKITVLYSVPSATQFPLFDLMIPAMRSLNFNDGNILTYLFGITPLIANIIWLFLFVGLMFLLNKVRIIEPFR